VPVISTDINPHDVTVRNLDFTYLPQTGKFDLNVTWLQPSFNYSQMSSYSLSYQVNGGKKITTSTVGVKILLLIILNLALINRPGGLYGSVDRPNAVRSAHTTVVKILQYRPIERS